MGKIAAVVAGVAMVTAGCTKASAIRAANTAKVSPQAICADDITGPRDMVLAREDVWPITDFAESSIRVVKFTKAGCGRVKLVTPTCDLWFPWVAGADEFLGLNGVRLWADVQMQGKALDSRDQGVKESVVVFDSPDAAGKAVVQQKAADCGREVLDLGAQQVAIEFIGKWTDAERAAIVGKARTRVANW